MAPTPTRTSLCLHLVPTSKETKAGPSWPLADVRPDAPLRLYAVPHSRVSALLVSYTGRRLMHAYEIMSWPQVFFDLGQHTIHQLTRTQKLLTFFLTRFDLMASVISVAQGRKEEAEKVPIPGSHCFCFHSTGELSLGTLTRSVSKCRCSLPCISDSVANQLLIDYLIIVVSQLD
jgi:hypothetical protein